MVARGRSPTGRGRALKPSPVRVRIPPPPRRSLDPGASTSSQAAPTVLLVTHDSVEVAVLGPVLVAGAAGPFHRSAAGELVVYLAFHRGGVRHADWSLAIWPERPVSLATAHSTSSDARRALGRDAAGRPHLPRGVDLRLGDSVTTDVERFASLAAADDPQRLLGAMDLIRGPLFAGLRRTDWAVFDGTQSEIEALVVRTALRGADAFLRLGAGEEAEGMVSQVV